MHDGACVKKFFSLTCSLQKQPPELLYKNVVLRNFAKLTGKQLRQRLSFNNVAGHACNFIKKESLAQVFFFKFCEISKNTCFIEHLGTTASEFGIS